MRKILLHLVIFIMLFSSLGLAPMPAPFTYYVSIDGNDQNFGTPASPFRTIQRCINVANNGDTCQVSAGTYNERINVKEGVIVICANPRTCIIAGAAINTNSTINGFYSLNNPLNDGGITGSGSGYKILNNKVEGSCMVGVKLNGANGLAEGNEISKSRQCSGSSDPDADGIRVFGSGHTIRGNYIHSISQLENPTAHIDCIQSWGGLINTIIHGNVCDVIHAGIQIDSGDVVINLTITNNVFNTSRGLNVYVDGVTVANNVFIGKIVSGVNGSAIGFRTSRNITFKNNIIYNTTGGLYVESGAIVASGNNVVWNDNSSRPGRWGGSISTDKFQTANPQLTGNWITGNQSLCYAGLGCSGLVTPTPTKTATATPSSTLTPTPKIPTVSVSPTAVITLSPTPVIATASKIPSSSTPLPPANTDTPSISPISPTARRTETIVPTVTITKTTTPAIATRTLTPRPPATNTPIPTGTPVFDKCDFNKNGSISWFERWICKWVTQ